MPKTFCPACLGYCRVRRHQYGLRVVCPECKSKFVAERLPRWRPNLVIIAIIALVILAVAIYGRYKVTKYVPGSPPSRSFLPPAHGVDRSEIQFDRERVHSVERFTYQPVQPIRRHKARGVHSGLQPVQVTEHRPDLAV
jgi:hypothetical protein